MAKLKKELGLISVFCLASGAMLSSGLFVLPAIVYLKCGPSILLSYMFASLLVLPTVLSKIELATAMPRAGGTYFYIERSMGPVPGFFGGLADWFALAMKSSFALVGIAIFLMILIETLAGAKLTPMQETVLLKSVAIVCCLGFVTLNILSVKHSSRLQIWMVVFLLAILAMFVGAGSRFISVERFTPFFSDKGWAAVFSTTGMVFVSYGGLTKVAGVGEEIKNPARSLPLGMLLAWFVVSVFYLMVIAVTIGLVDSAELQGSLTPISTAARKFVGLGGYFLLAFAAMLAFVTTANAGIMAASRSPMAMSRDKLLPSGLAKINERFKTPHVSILLTGGFMIAAIAFLDIESLVKTASTLMIVLFILANISVIIMRESRIQSYRPGFKSPLYPYVQIVAIIFYIALIVDMGKTPLLITAGFIVLSTAWFFLYVRRSIVRQSALTNLVQRLTNKELKTVTLENELRDILLERDEIIEDRFDQLIRDCQIIDLKGEMAAEQVFTQISQVLAARLNADEGRLFAQFVEREAEGGTVIKPGVAIPHIIVTGENKFDIVVLRAVDGVNFPHAEVPVHTIFALAGSKDERNYHLRALMAIAQIAEEKHFEDRWFAASDAETIRNLLLLSTRKRQTSE